MRRGGGSRRTAGVRRSWDALASVRPERGGRARPPAPRCLPPSLWPAAEVRGGRCLGARRVPTGTLLNVTARRRARRSGGERSASRGCPARQRGAGGAGAHGRARPLRAAGQTWLWRSGASGGSGAASSGGAGSAGFPPARAGRVDRRL